MRWRCDGDAMEMRWRCGGDAVERKRSVGCRRAEGAVGERERRLGALALEQLRLDVVQVAVEESRVLREELGARVGGGVAAAQDDVDHGLRRHGARRA